MIVKVVKLEGEIVFRFGILWMTQHGDTAYVVGSTWHPRTLTNKSSPRRKCSNSRYKNYRRGLSFLMVFYSEALQGRTGIFAISRDTVLVTLLCSWIFAKSSHNMRQLLGCWQLLSTMGQSSQPWNQPRWRGLRKVPEWAYPTILPPVVWNAPLTLPFQNFICQYTYMHKLVQRSFLVSASLNCIKMFFSFCACWFEGKLDCYSATFYSNANNVQASPQTYFQILPRRKCLEDSQSLYTQWNVSTKSGRVSQIEKFLFFSSKQWNALRVCLYCHWSLLTVKSFFPAKLALVHCWIRNSSGQLPLRNASSNGGHGTEGDVWGSLTRLSFHYTVIFLGIVTPIGTLDRFEVTCRNKPSGNLL